MTLGIQQLMRQTAHVVDSFHAAVYSSHDLETALAATTPQCVLENVPMLTGSHDGNDLRRYLTEDVLPHIPADLTFRRVSRTVDRLRVVDEDLVGFTHDRELPWLLPGAAPTHRRAEVLAVSIVTFSHTTRLAVTESRIVAHRTLWDGSGLMAQLKLAPTDLVVRATATGPA